MKFTVLGSSGFIGGAMVQHLRGLGHEVDTPARDAQSLRDNAGHVIYAIGLTGDFRERPHDTIEAHVNVLQRLIKDAKFDSWLYLSSTRVYGGLPDDMPAKEDTALNIRPGADSLYDLSKLTGEAICLSHKQPTARVARLSNVYGACQGEHTFLGSVVKTARETGKVTIREAPASSKDYVSIKDVVKTLTAIATQGQERLYNIASGRPVTHEQLAVGIRQAGYEAEFAANGAVRAFPPVSIDKITKEFGSKPRSVLDDLALLLGNTQQAKQGLRQ